MQSEQIDKLAEALAKAQAQMQNAVMNRVNPHFKSKYADLSSVLDAIREPLGKNGLAVTQTMEIREGGMVLRTVLMHTSGQWLASEYPLPTTARPQEMGSAQTYARRYSLAAIVCNSADEDDDANAAEDGKQKLDASGKSPKAPAPVSIVKPVAGAGGKPAKLEVPLNADKKPDWIAFGQQLIAEVNGGGDPDDWLKANQESTDLMRQDAPKVYDRMMKALPHKEAAQ